MTPKPDVSEERKTQIYQAALACFARKGYHRTTMDDIVAESGLSKGALYWYFKSKKDLFLAMFREVMDQFAQVWQSIAADPTSSATAKLQASLAFFRSELGEMLPFYAVMMEAWALTRHDEDIQNLTREFYGPYLDIMVQIIEGGIASGEFRAYPPRAVALVLMTLIDGIVLALGTGLWEHDWNEIMDTAESLVFHGLGATDTHAAE